MSTDHDVTSNICNERINIIVVPLFPRVQIYLIKKLFFFSQLRMAFYVLGIASRNWGWYHRNYPDIVLTHPKHQEYMWIYGTSSDDERKFGQTCVDFSLHFILLRFPHFLFATFSNVRTAS
jgi:hypothetical protein